MDVSDHCKPRRVTKAARASPISEDCFHAVHTYTTSIFAAAYTIQLSRNLKKDQSSKSAIMAAALFEPTLSTSAPRPPQLSETKSLADSLPSVNFGFEDLRERMARFTVRFDEFIENGWKRVLEERNQFRMNVAELQGKTHI